MNCPVDDTQLQMTDRNGVEIDYCPRCRGVWLDRGELDKIIERSGSSQGASYAAPSRSDDHRHGDDDDDDHYSRGGHDDHNQGYPQQKKRKKEGFLGDLFDF